MNILGKYTLHDQVVLHLSDYPHNLDQSLKDLKIGIESLLAKKKQVAVNIDIREGKLCLVIDYLVSFDDRFQMRSDIINLIFKKMNKVISIPR